MGWGRRSVGGVVLVISLLVWMALGAGLAPVGQPTLPYSPSDGDVACRAKEVPWSEARPLRVRDFRSEERVRGLSAEAATGIGARSAAEPDNRHFRITITSFFDPCDSWMREEERNDYTLAHEQLHFDITELHARKLAARYVREVRDHGDFLRVHQRYYDEAWAASRAMQVKYDSEVYGDREAQERWGREVAAALAEYEAYAEKVVVLPIR